MRYYCSHFCISSSVATLDWKTMPRPIVALSPMADMTDSAFCRTIKGVARAGTPTARRTSIAMSEHRRGAQRQDPTTPELIVFREMVSAEAVVRGNDKTLGMTAIHDDERPLVQQIFGSDPATMAEAARIIAADHHPEGFDINMGCPVYKLVHNFNGCALMNDPQLAGEIVRAVKAVISVPLSVKIRLGWEDPTQCIAFAQALEAAGADMITVHGRTKTQGYSGVADWEMVGRVKAAVRIPVLVNGDIHTADKVADALDVSHADGVLIARGALGNPWIFRDINDVLAGRTPAPVTFGERMAVVRRHLALHVEQYGPTSVPLFRKHLSWYFKGMPGMKAYKDPMMKAATVDELEHVFAQFEADHDTTDTQTFRPALLTKK